MRLNPGAFNRFLGGAVRQDVMWRRASACPCISPSSGQPNANCPSCQALGWRWGPATPAWAGINNMSPSKASAAFGVWESGDATLTIPSDSPMYAAGRYDRLRVGNATMAFSQVLTPGINERLRGEILSISRVFWLDGDAVVDGPEPSIDSAGLLTWPQGGPPEDVSYTVEGQKADELFIAIPQPNNRNAGVVGLPRRVMVRRFDLMGRAGGNDTEFS